MSAGAQPARATVTSSPSSTRRSSRLPPTTTAGVGLCSQAHLPELSAAVIGSGVGLGSKVDQ